MPDIYKLVTTSDRIFDAWMCAMFGVEWRWEMPYVEQRHHAKLWMHSYNYGLGATDMKRLLESQSKRFRYRERA